MVKTFIPRSGKWAEDIYKTLTHEEKAFYNNRDPINSQPDYVYESAQDFRNTALKHFITKIDNIPVCSVDVYNDSHNNEISLAVMTRNDEKYRHKGYAKQTIETALSWIKDSKFTNVIWECDERNTRSVNLARKVGFNMCHHISWVEGKLELA